MVITKRGLVIRWGLALACSIAVAGCAEDPDEGGSANGVSGAGGAASEPCMPGAMLDCGPCPGAIGLSICSPQGVRGDCNCPAPPSMAGTGGLAGMLGGGAGGAAGMMAVAGASGMTGGAGGEVVSGGAGGMTGGAGGMTMTGGMGGMGGMASGGMGGTGGEIPEGATCADAAEWDPAWADFEEEVLRLTNEARAVGHNCDSMGQFGAADPLTMSPILRCSSRLHSLDMGENGYFDHTGQDGRSPFKRMEDAGYMGFMMGENIAKGQQTPSEVVDGWLDSDGHCSNMMNPDFTEIGVGYWEGEAESMFFNGNKLWTQNFGSQDCPWCN
jgi:uncharacterized protein YkwD